MEISESIHEGLLEPSYKKLLGQTPTVLVTAVKIEDKPPCYRLTLRWAREMASTENDMQMARHAN